MGRGRNKHSGRRQGPQPQQRTQATPAQGAGCQWFHIGDGDGKKEAWADLHDDEVPVVVDWVHGVVEISSDTDLAKDDEHGFETLDRLHGDVEISSDTNLGEALPDEVEAHNATEDVEGLESWSTLLAQLAEMEENVFVLATRGGVPNGLVITGAVSKGCPPWPHLSMDFNNVLVDDALPEEVEARDDKEGFYAGSGVPNGLVTSDAVFEGCPPWSHSHVDFDEAFPKGEVLDDVDCESRLGLGIPGCWYGCHQEQRDEEAHAEEQEAKIANSFKTFCEEQEVKRTIAARERAKEAATQKRRRIDPGDGMAYTWLELSKYYDGWFPRSEIEAYWRTRCLWHPPDDPEARVAWQHRCRTLAKTLLDLQASGVQQTPGSNLSNHAAAVLEAGDEAEAEAAQSRLAKLCRELQQAQLQQAQGGADVATPTENKTSEEERTAARPRRARKGATRTQGHSNHK